MQLLAVPLYKGCNRPRGIRYYTCSPEQVANEVHVKEGNVDGSKGRASNSRMRHEASICIYLVSESTELLSVPRDGARTQLSTKANGNAR